jgi:hypothetical protein
MPQLDTATYFGQVTWLILVFVGYYRIVRGDLIPALTRLRKIRAKKKTHGLARTSQMRGEAKNVMHGYDRAVGKAALGALSLIQLELDNQGTWSKTALDAVSRKQLGEVNARYLDSVASLESETILSIEDLADIELGDEDDLEEGKN